MLIGLISDLHANLYATKVVLDMMNDEIGVDKILCAGDIVGYYTHPLEIIDLLIENKIQAVIGNHDAIAVSSNFRHEIKYFNNVAKQALRWTRKKLKSSPEHWNWIKNLNYTKKVNIKNCKFLLVHATPPPDKPKEWIYYYYFSDPTQDDQLQDWLDINHTDVIVLGHTHVPFIYKNISSRTNPRFVINPGSVGQPRDNDHRTSFMTIDTQSFEIQHHRSDYNIKKVCKGIKTYKLPKQLCDRLHVGH